jgi:acetylornithine deacetylase/succinyl-diaminopimelate desuccinylase-like protein
MKNESPLRATASRIALAAACGIFIAASPPPPGPVPPADNQKLAHDIFKELVEIHSVHDVGTKETAAVMAKYLIAGGFAPEDVHILPETKYPNQVNVVVRLHGKGPSKGNLKPILYICHMDVVEAKAEDWTLPPFQFIEKDGYFYGRGTSDMKDEDSAVAASMIRLKQEGFVPDRDVIVAFTADEEVGEEQDGPAFLLAEHRDLIDAGLVIDPDGGSGEIQNGKRLDFGVETSEKSYVTFRLDVTNKGGHSSEPRPDNAIYQLANGLVKLSHYQFPITLNATTRLYFKSMAMLQSGRMRADMLAVARAKPDMKAAWRLTKDVPLNAILHSTCVATMLNAGVQENALPAHAQATVQCRIMPNETVAATQATIAKVVGDPAIKVSQLGMVTIAPESPPTKALMSSVEKVVHSMWPGVPVIPDMAAGASDAIFTRNAGMPSYGIGGGWNDIDDIRMHGRDERHEIGDFYQSVEFTYRLIKELSKAP